MRHCEIWTSLGCTRSVILQSKDDVRRDHCSQWRCLPCWLFATRSLVLLLSGLFGWLFGRLFGWLFFVPLLFQERSRPRTTHPHFFLTRDFRHMIQNSVLSILVIPECLSVVISTVRSWCMDVYVQTHFCATHTHIHIHVYLRINQWLCSWELSPEHLDTLLSRVS